jgi:hypothetical protein
VRFFLLLLLAIVSVASAQPFLYADTAGTSISTTTCGIYMDALPKVTTPTVLVGTVVTCKYDLSGIANGSHTVKMTAITNDPAWGALESPPSPPFVFVKPAGITAPVNLRVAP